MNTYTLIFQEIFEAFNLGDCEWVIFFYYKCYKKKSGIVLLDFISN